MKNLILFVSFLTLSFSAIAQNQSQQMYIEPNVSIWLPGLESYNHNHRASLQFGLEVGKYFIQWEDLSIAGGLGLQISPQQLEEHLDDETATMVQAYINGRVAYNIKEINTTFAQLGAGLVHEFAEEEDGHAPPKMASSVMLGIGSQLHLNDHLNIGVRLDLTYPKGSRSRVSWTTIGLMLGLKF